MNDNEGSYVNRIFYALFATELVESTAVADSSSIIGVTLKLGVVGPPSLSFVYDFVLLEGGNYCFFFLWGRFFLLMDKK